MVLSAEFNTAAIEHADLALKTMIVFVIIAIIRLFLMNNNFESKKIYRYPVFAVGLLGVFFVSETAEHGGVLVFKYGIGIEKVERISKQLRVAENKIPVNPGIVFEENGSWKWYPTAGAGDILQKQFEWIEGSITGLKKSVFIDPDKGPVLALNSINKLK